MATVPETIDKLTPPTDKPDVLYEFVDGEWKEVPRMGLLAGMVASVLVHKLNAFALPARLGVAVCEVLFRLAPDGQARRPDVSYVSYDRWPLSVLLDEDPPVCDVVPKLAVEVVSPTNGAVEVADKVRDYFFAGVQLIWVIYPTLHTIYVHDSPESVRVLTDKHELDGGAVIPGFKLSVAELFASLVRPQ